MKKLLVVVPLAIAAASAAPKAQAQTVVLNGLGSSAMYLESGLGTSRSPINAQCWWTGNNSATAGNVVTATDNSTPGVPAVADSGNAWVAWTTGGGTCAAPGSTAKIYAYLQTDSVVGDRCLFNAHPASGVTTTCSIAYPTTTPASAALLFPANDSSKTETALPSTVASLLNAATVNYAGTDIRPEDAAFAVARAATTCGAATGIAQYRGLGYAPGSTIATLNSVESFYSSSVFHTTQFTLPTTYFVTPIGATAVVVAVNGSSTGLGPITNISSASLAQFLDGRNSWSGQANATPSASGQPVTVLVREPLSGTYNTMEYNVPNRTMADASGFPFMTSQDNGVNQPTAQQTCGNAGTSDFNPLNVMTPSGAHRRRAIGTGQELAEVLDTTASVTTGNGNGTDILGYGFWSAANFKGFAGVTTTHYLTVDGVDPLRDSSVTGNPIPTSSTDLAAVTMSRVQDGTYPIWSLLRFVTADMTSKASADDLATATKTFGIIDPTTPSTHPDFIVSDNMTVVRSHFIPPAGAGEPAANAASDGTVGQVPFGEACSSDEVGGDVGGVVMTLVDDSNYCANNNVTTGNVGNRR